MPSARKTAVVGQSLCKTHADACADTRRDANEKGFPAFMRRKGRSKERSERRYGAVHQTGQAGLHDLQQKKPLLPGGFVLAQLSVRNALGCHRMMAFLLCEVPQKLPRPGISCASRGHFVKPFGFHLHGLSAFLDSLQSQGADEPDRAAAHKSAHVLAPNERHMLAKARAIALQQPMPMLILLVAHFLKLPGLLWIILTQSISEVVVDTGILFLEGNGQREDFLLGQSFESAHGSATGNHPSATEQTNCVVSLMAGSGEVAAFRIF